jgi:hypothetical protein
MVRVAVLGPGAPEPHSLDRIDRFALRPNAKQSRSDTHLARVRRMPDQPREVASLQVSLSSDHDRVAAVGTLRAFFEVARRRRFAEIWVRHGAFPSLCALVHGESAWLTFLRYDGDAGFSSRNPAYCGPPDRTIGYMLGNGQVDEYPASWAYPTEKVFDELLVFAREGRASGSITWFNDSGDGADGPQDPGFAPPL